MKRIRTPFLLDWIKSKNRKPLVIKGARQVGKTWIVRYLAKKSERILVELNFEKKPELKSLFNSNDPKEILRNISTLYERPTTPSNSLLFLDEIQAAPELLSKLRWFAEEMQELPVIAAGSLLEFTLAKHEFSMPVGRINYMYLEPLSFEEFLHATTRSSLADYLESFQWSHEIPIEIQSRLTQAVKEYSIIGGMPAAVSTWKESQNFSQVNQVHSDLLATYRDDFAKYSGRISLERLEDILNSVPRQLGKKFIFSEANAHVKAAALRQALDLLSMAKVCHKALSTAANGLPLGAETNKKHCKVFMLDIGLASASLGLSLRELNSVDELTLINNGAIAEQLVAQQLRTLPMPFTPPNLYYWQKDKGQAEVDFITSCESSVIPVEVKAGKRGTLKSLHQFMHEKKGSLALRINSDSPSITNVETKTSAGNPVQYKLASLPFYLLNQTERLLKLTDELF